MLRQVNTGFSIFFKCKSTSLFTGGIISKNLNIFHEHLMEESLVLGGTNYNFKPLIWKLYSQVQNVIS
jgi:hypothetical protein